MAVSLSTQLRRKRRQQGRCVQCGIEAPRNHKTGQPYARCDLHRLANNVSVAKRKRGLQVLLELGQ